MKVFLSYSTRGVEGHQDWVRSLSDQLNTDGFETTFDQYDLRLGQDMFTFMERIDTDEYDKVVLVCDHSYTKRADQRIGGVGAEVQILARAVYNDTEQTRYLPIFTETDEQNRPTLPKFLQSRLAIDFSNPDHYEASYNKLCLALLGETVHQKPEVGAPHDAASFRERINTLKKKASTKKNTHEGDLENLDHVHIGDKNASKDQEEAYTEKNTVKGNIKNVKNFRLGDDYQ